MKLVVHYAILLSILTFKLAYSEERKTESNQIKFQTEQHYNTVDTWVNDMMSGTKSVNGTVTLQRFKDPMYIVVRPIEWTHDGVNSTIKSVTVPKGFVTDLTSTPSIFWSSIRPDGDYVLAAIVHDYLYWTQGRKRKEADQIFNLIMKEFEIPKVKRIAIHKAVDWWGGSAWNNNAKIKGNGEKRILIRFPQDPKITWDVWKNEAGVFK